GAYWSREKSEGCCGLESLLLQWVGRVCPQRGQAATKWREAFGVRRIPALLLRAVRNSPIAPEYGALQTLRALVCQSVFSLKMHSRRAEYRRALTSRRHRPIAQE